MARAQVHMSWEQGDMGVGARGLHGDRGMGAEFVAEAICGNSLLVAIATGPVPGTVFEGRSVHVHGGALLVQISLKDPLPSLLQHLRVRRAAAMMYYRSRKTSSQLSLTSAGSASRPTSASEGPACDCNDVLSFT